MYEAITATNSQSATTKEDQAFRLPVRKMSLQLCLELHKVASKQTHTYVEFISLSQKLRAHIFIPYSVRIVVYYYDELWVEVSKCIAELLICDLGAC